MYCGQAHSHLNIWLSTFLSSAFSSVFTPTGDVAAVITGVLPTSDC